MQIETSLPNFSSQKKMLIIHQNTSMIEVQSRSALEKMEGNFSKEFDI